MQFGKEKLGELFFHRDLSGKHRIHESTMCIVVHHATAFNVGKLHPPNVQFYRQNSQ